MRARALLLIAAAAGVGHVYASYSVAERWAGFAGALALGALAAFAVANRRIDWSVAVLGALAVAVVLPAVWYEPWYDDFPIAGTPADRMPVELRVAVLRAAHDRLIRFSWIAPAVLAAAVAFAAFVYRRPRRRDPKIVATTVGVAVLVLAAVLWPLWDIGQSGPGETLRWTWLALLAALVFFAVAGYAGEPVGAVGGTLLGCWALALVDQIARTVPVLWEWSVVPGEEAEVGAISGVFWPTDPWAALLAVMLLGAGGVLALTDHQWRRALDRVAG